MTSKPTAIIAFAMSALVLAATNAIGQQPVIYQQAQPQPTIVYQIVPVAAPQQGVTQQIVPIAAPQEVLPQPAMPVYQVSGTVPPVSTMPQQIGDVNFVDDSSVIDAAAPCSGCRSCRGIGRRLLNRLGLGCWAHHDEYGCSSLHSELRFIFGSCRAFFGERCSSGPPIVPTPPGYSLPPGYWR